MESLHTGMIMQQTIVRTLRYIRYLDVTDTGISVNSNGRLDGELFWLTICCDIFLTCRNSQTQFALSSSPLPLEFTYHSFIPIRKTP